MDIDLQEQVISWDVFAADIGGFVKISSHADRAEATQAAINYKIANPASLAVWAQPTMVIWVRSV
jgi:hypothetical protein